MDFKKDKVGENDFEEVRPREGTKSEEEEKS